MSELDPTTTDAPHTAVLSITLSELEEQIRWVFWLEKIIKGRRTKIPYDPKNGRKAKTDDPRTWGTCAEARRAHAPHLKNEAKGGIGLILGPHRDGLHVVGFDLDTCRDPLTGELELWATAIVERMNAYVEVSPSQKGVKGFMLCRDSDLSAIRDRLGTVHKKKWTIGVGEHPPAVELHLSNSYYTVTGQVLGNYDADNLSPIGVPPAVLNLCSLEGMQWLIDKAESLAQSNRDKSNDSSGHYNSGKSNDESGSGYGFRFALAQCRAGVSYDKAVEAIFADDAEAGEWARRVDDRQLKRAWAKAEAIIAGHDSSGPSGFPFTEKGVADCFRERYEGQLLFNHASRQWHEWTGTHWRPETTMLAFHFAVRACAEAVTQGATVAEARGMLRSSAASGVECIARADRAFAVSSTHFDLDPWLLGTPAGTVDLRTGALRPARQGDYITKLTAVGPIPLDEFDPNRHCPLFLSFIHDATGGDTGLICALQRWFGHNLTGDIRLEALVFIHGPGGSGKTTLVITIADLLGDYCINIPVETLTEPKNERHPTELARLHGARMAWASETQQGRPWNQKRITELTGGDTITARFMRRDFFSFKPQFKLVIVGNNQPSLRNVDAAIRRRFNVVPFRHRPSRVDDTLKARLQEEWPGILSWLILGCLDWQKSGLVWPKVVTDYTREYLTNQDVFQKWLDECCDIHPAYADTTEQLWDSWSRFSFAEGGDPGSKTQTFPDALREHSFTPAEKIGPKRGRGWRGLRVKPAEKDRFGNLFEENDLL